MINKRLPSDLNWPDSFTGEETTPREINGGKEECLEKLAGNQKCWHGACISEGEEVSQPGNLGQRKHPLSLPIVKGQN